MLTRDQLGHFAEHGYVVLPQLVPQELIAKASARVDRIVAHKPPGEDVRGNHFYFPKAANEPDLISTLMASPAFDAAQALTAPGMLEPPWQVQIALNIPPYPLDPGRPHIDAAIAEPTPGFVPNTFTMLAGVMLSDQERQNSGNLWIWPGTHLTHAEYFRERGVEAYCAYPDIDLPEPVQLTGRAGDVLLAHYLLGHNIGGNYASETVRRMLYFRISRHGHAERSNDFLQDAWLEYDAVRALSVSRGSSIADATGDRAA